MRNRCGKGAEILRRWCGEPLNHILSIGSLSGFYLCLLSSGFFEGKFNISECFELILRAVKSVCFLSANMESGLTCNDANFRMCEWCNSFSELCKTEPYGVTYLWNCNYRQIYHLLKKTGDLFSMKNKDNLCFYRLVHYLFACTKTFSQREHLRQ